MKRVMKGPQVEDFEIITFPKLGSPKIDGFRCVLSDIARTSRMREFPNHYVHKTLKGLLPRNVYLDGELVVGKRRGQGVLQRTSSGLTSQAGEPDWRLWVFDAPRPGLGFEDRLRLARSHVEAIDHPSVRCLKHKMIHNLEELEAYISWALKNGFEGVMLRDPEGEYKEGKSTLRQQGLLKIKPFETHEARIIDYYEEMHNTNEAKEDPSGKKKRSSAKAGKVPKGTLGGLVGLDTITGVEVRCGGGFSAAQRSGFWRDRESLVGQYFTYKKQTVGEKNKPRHPNFVCIRPTWDFEPGV